MLDECPRNYNRKSARGFHKKMNDKNGVTKVEIFVDVKSCLLDYLASSSTRANDVTVFFSFSGGTH